MIYYPCIRRRHVVHTVPAGAGIDISATTITVGDRFSYTGSQIRPPVYVVYGATTLKEDEDYTLTYGRNVDIGTGTVVVDGLGNFTGSRVVTFEIGEQAPDEWAIGSIGNLCLAGEKTELAEPYVYQGDNSGKPENSSQFSFQGDTAPWWYNFDGNGDGVVSVWTQLSSAPLLATVPFDHDTGRYTLQGMGKYGTVTNDYLARTFNLSRCVATLCMTCPPPTPCTPFKAAVMINAGSSAYDSGVNMIPSGTNGSQYYIGYNEMFQLEWTEDQVESIASRVVDKDTVAPVDLTRKTGCSPSTPFIGMPDGLYLMSSRNPGQAGYVDSGRKFMTWLRKSPDSKIPAERSSFSTGTWPTTLNSASEYPVLACVDLDVPYDFNSARWAVVKVFDKYIPADVKEKNGSYPLSLNSSHARYVVDPSGRHLYIFNHYYPGASIQESQVMARYDMKVPFDVSTMEFNSIIPLSGPGEFKVMGFMPVPSTGQVIELINKGSWLGLAIREYSS